MCKPTLWLFLSLLMMQHFCYASNSAAPEDIISAKIRDFIRTLMKCKKTPGMSVAVVKDGKVLMAEGFGFSNLETNETVNGNTLFEIASMTKAFTAMTLVKVLQGRRDIKLTTPVKDILNITFFDKQTTEYATLEDLLSHRTGIPDNRFIRLNTNYTRTTISRFLKYFIPYKDFRTGFIYNNQLYGLIAYITEILNNASWENTVSDLLLEPIGMDDSTFAENNFTNKNVAMPYFDNKRISMDFVRKWARIGGSGSIFSNAVDMAKWLLFLLNDGKVNQTTVLNSTDFQNVFISRNYISKTTWKYHRPTIPVTLSFSQYALGWKKGFYRGYPIVTHTGTTYGYSGMITLFPDEKLGIFSVINDGDVKNEIRFLLHNFIADLQLREKPWINKTTVCTFPKPWTTVPYREKSKRLPLPLISYKIYEGTYRHRLYGDLIVTYNSLHSNLQLNYGIGNFSLISIKSNNSLTFFGQGIGEVWFMELGMVKFMAHKGRKQRIAALIITNFGRKSPPIFKKLDEYSKTGCDIIYSKKKWPNHTCQ